MSIQVANLGTYEFEAYPDKVDITFTNTENSADVVALTMENVTPDNNQLDTDALTKGATYDVTAVATSNSGYVLNPTSDTTTVATGLLLGDSSLITDAYSYSDGFANNIFAWPRAYDGFDLENGGTAGYAPAMGGGKTEFVATPVSSGDGSYTYDLAAGNWTRSGKLELKADGTFTAELEALAPSTLVSTAAAGSITAMALQPSATTPASWSSSKKQHVKEELCHGIQGIDQTDVTFGKMCDLER